MRERYKVRSKTIICGIAVCLCILITLQNTAKGKTYKGFFKLLTEDQDTTVRKKGAKKIPPDSSSANKANAIDKSDTTRKKFDSLGNPIDSLHASDTLRQKIDTVNMSKDSLDAPVNYSAEDSGVLILTKKQFYLYGKATTDYKDMKLEAANINFDQSTNIIKAYGGTDTAQGALNLPKFTQGGSTSISDSIIFNMKNQRGLVKNTYYQEGDMFVKADVLKKVDKNVEFGFRTRFTTCNLDTPHFAFRTRKVKIINDKIAVSGPAFPEFEGVPMPVAIPFGIFPLSRGRHSGLLPPQFASSEDFGLGLEGLGYYKVINDNLDVITRGNIYSYGGWSLNVNPKYYKRYKYNGALNFSIQHTKLLNRSGLSKDEFTTSQNFFITWSHSMDSRARPGTSFSASVNAGSTQYNKYVTNNPMRNFQNQLSSSITYGKTWDQGKYVLSVSANHNQNNNTRLVTLNLPTVNFTANTIYPFQKKEQVGTPKWYEKLGIAYNGNLLTQASFYDSLFNFQRILDTTQWGAQHNIPISLTLPAFGPFIVSPSISYSERWYGQQIVLDWNQKANKNDTTISRGFYTAREMSFGLSTNTRIFGTYNFPKSKGIMAIRHEIKPFISANYKPDLVHQYFYNVQIDSLKNIRRASKFDGGIMGSYSEGQFGGFNFGIDNLLEMKVHDKSDTSQVATKKIKLIDGLGVTGGYNFFADSLKWSPIAISMRSTLFNTVNITAGANLDPYGVDSFGRRVDKLLWKDGKIGRFTNGNIAISTSFKSKSTEGKDKNGGTNVPVDQTMTPDEQQRQLEYVRQNPAEFVDFNIPWNVQMSFALNFSRILAADYKNFITNTTANISLNGDFSLTPKWKIGGNTYFDFKTAKIQTLTMFITREMHCWQMAINVTPIGPYKSFNISINPKSGILRDLKINRSRFFYNQ